MIIDFNAHFGAGPSTIEWRSAQECSEIQRAAGIDFAVASDLATAFHDAGFEEDSLPRSIIPFASLNPGFSTLSLPTVKGLRVYPAYQAWEFQGSAAARLLALCRDHGLILQVYLRLQDPRALPVTVGLAEAIKQVSRLVSADEDIRFVISGASYAEVKANPELFGRANVWTDISHVQHPINSLPKLLDLIDSSRVLFGSGAPVMYPYANLFRVMNSPIPARARERILWRNAQELLQGGTQ